MVEPCRPVLASGRRQQIEDCGPWPRTIAVWSSGLLLLLLLSAGPGCVEFGDLHFGPPLTDQDAGDAAQGDAEPTGPCLEDDPPFERCDGRDNDCNGETDDGFDLRQDPAHCGECNRSCHAPHADAGCTEGRCRLLTCDPEWYNVSGSASDGCNILKSETSALLLQAEEADRPNQVHVAFPAGPVGASGLAVFRERDRNLVLPLDPDGRPRARPDGSLPAAPTVLEDETLDLAQPVELLALGEDQFALVWDHGESDDSPRYRMLLDSTAGIINGRTQIASGCRSRAHRCALAIREGRLVSGEARTVGERLELHLNGEQLRGWETGAADPLRLRGLVCAGPGQGCLVAYTRAADSHLYVSHSSGGEEQELDSRFEGRLLLARSLGQRVLAVWTRTGEEGPARTSWAWLDASTGSPDHAEEPPLEHTHGVPAAGALLPHPVAGFVLLYRRDDGWGRLDFPEEEGPAGPEAVLPATFEQLPRGFLGLEQLYLQDGSVATREGAVLRRGLAWSAPAASPLLAAQTADQGLLLVWEGVAGIWGGLRPKNDTLHPRLLYHRTTEQPDRVAVALGDDQVALLELTGADLRLIRFHAGTGQTTESTTTLRGPDGQPLPLVPHPRDPRRLAARLFPTADAPHRLLLAVVGADRQGDSHWTTLLIDPAQAGLPPISLQPLAEREVVPVLTGPADQALLLTLIPQDRQATLFSRRIGPDGRSGAERNNLAPVLDNGSLTAVHEPGSGLTRVLWLALAGTRCGGEAEYLTHLTLDPALQEYTPASNVEATDACPLWVRGVPATGRATRPGAGADAPPGGTILLWGDRLIADGQQQLRLLSLDSLGHPLGTPATWRLPRLIAPTAFPLTDGAGLVWREAADGQLRLQFKGLPHPW